MIERPNIDELLAGELGEWLQGQTQVREEAREKSNSRLTTSAFIILPLAAFLFFGPPFAFQLKIWIMIAAAAGAGFWIYAPRSAAIKQTKEGINTALARALGLQYQHEIEPGLGFMRAKGFKMVPSFQRSNFEDMWSGEIAGRAFSLHEAELKQRRRSGKRTTYVTVFRGPVMTIDCDRNFHSTTLVERAGRHRKFLFFGEKDEVKLEGIDMQKVDMVHPEFEDEFTIFSTDPVEAKYLVHPTYVERMIALETAFSGRKIRTLFHQGELTVVLETKNMFESGGMDAGRDREMIETCVSQFMSMTQLATSLNEEAR